MSGTAPGSGRLVAIVVTIAVLLALGLVAAVGFGFWFTLRGGPDDDQVVSVEAMLALAPVQGGTRVQLVLRPVGEVSAPVRVAAGAIDEAYTIGVPPFTGPQPSGPVATGQQVVWTDAQSAGQPLGSAQVGFEPLRRNGSEYELTAFVPSVAGRRVVIVRGLGQFLDVRTLTVRAPSGAVSSCLVTYSQSAHRAHKVTPCLTSTSMRPELPAGLEPVAAQGEQQVRFELTIPS